jgi:hypothetical protein
LTRHIGRLEAMFCCDLFSLDKQTKKQRALKELGPLFKHQLNHGTQVAPERRFTVWGNYLSSIFSH